MYPKAYRTLFRHWGYRFGTFVLGVVLLYAPAALLTRLVLYLSNSPLLPDAHRICMRMPIQWLAQPWMYGVMIAQPAYLGSVLVLPLVALFFAPVFCGWMCPAGHITEFASRIVPSRFQVNLGGRFNATPIRYGFTVGMMGAALIGGNVCCSFCNFSHAQSLISAIFGNPLGLTYWASFTIVSFVLWLGVLGLFTKGGRGWCNLLCPAGALQGLTHTIGARLGIGRGARVDASRCRNCKSCATECPTWAISNRGDVAHIDSHACNACMDCAQVCPEQAIAYGRLARQRREARVREAETAGA
jgi:ferredoxin-type protein NapH